MVSVEKPPPLIRTLQEVVDTNQKVCISAAAGAAIQVFTYLHMAYICMCIHVCMYIDVIIYLHMIHRSMVGRKTPWARHR